LPDKTPKSNFFFEWKIVWGSKICLWNKRKLR